MMRIVTLLPLDGNFAEFLRGAVKRSRPCLVRALLQKTSIDDTGIGYRELNTYMLACKDVNFAPNKLVIDLPSEHPWCSFLKPFSGTLRGFLIYRQLQSSNLTQQPQSHLPDFTITSPRIEAVIDRAVCEENLDVMTTKNAIDEEEQYMIDLERHMKE
jgi:hypothetical protein